MIGRFRPRHGGVTPSRVRALAAVLVCLATAAGCASVVGRVEPIRLGELLEQGDPQRRASHRLLVEGLEADARGSSARAKGRYDRALQLEPDSAREDDEIATR